MFQIWSCQMFRIPLLVKTGYTSSVPFSVNGKRDLSSQSSLLFSCQAVSDSLWPHGLKHTRLPRPPLSPRVCSDWCPLSQWRHPTILSCVIPFSCPQSFPVSGSFPMSWLLTSGGQSTGASASVPPTNIQGWFPLGLIDLLAVSETLKNLLQHHSSKASVLQRSVVFLYTFKMDSPELYDVAISRAGRLASKNNSLGIPQTSLKVMPLC